jgi:hypothetical protein
MPATHELLRPFAESIFVKFAAQRRLQLSARELPPFRESICDDIKKCSNFLVFEVSEAAQREAETLGVDLCHKNWHDQPSFDRDRRTFHFEHVKPVKAVYDLCSEAKSPEEILEVLVQNMRVAWILKNEDDKLTGLGYRSKRPNPDAAYAEAGINLVRCPGTGE